MAAPAAAAPEAGAASGSAPAADNKSSNNERKVLLHPLAIIGISDHHTSIEAGGSIKPRGSKVLGLLWGRQQGLEVDIMDAVELGYEQGPDGAPIIDAETVMQQKALYTEVYKNYDLLGWYSVGQEVVELDVRIHREMTKYNESPFFLQMQPSPDAEAKDLPVSLYESEMHMVNDVPTMLFVSVEFQLRSTQAEQITMERVAKSNSNRSADQSSLEVQMTELSSALRTLKARSEVLVSYLEATKNGTIPPDYRILRQVSSVCNQLPAVDADELKAEFLSEYNDALLVNYMASITKGAASINALADKFAVVSTNSRNGPHRP